MLKILHLDIETAPKLAYVFRMWKENINPFAMESDWYMFSWRAMWDHDDVIHGQRLYGQEAIDQDDSRIMTQLWNMLDEADVVVAHNGDKFDIPSINTRFLANGLTPPSPYKQVDTLKIAKRMFKFSSNRLDYLGEFLGVGRKIDTGGMELWVRCMKGDDEALEAMYEYNGQDVALLKMVYRKLLPYSHSAPNHGVCSETDNMKCGKCGSENIQQRGYYHTNISSFKRYVCKDCGGWNRSRINVRTKEQMQNTLLPV